MKDVPHKLLENVKNAPTKTSFNVIHALNSTSSLKINALIALIIAFTAKKQKIALFVIKDMYSINPNS